MKFYFAGAIRGGREKLDTYIAMNKLMENYGEILDKHVANPDVNKIEKNQSLEFIYERDVNWIKECDVLIAEVSTTSLGVGYEIAYAEKLGKKIICAYDSNINLSAMIGGNKYIELIKYNDTKDLLKQLEVKLKEL